MPVLYRRFQALLAATESPWTRDLRHVKSTIPRFWLKSPQGGPSVSAVKVQNRIKWWNIVPGDQVRVLGSKDTSLREVYAINRLSNRVLLKKERVRRIGFYRSAFVDLLLPTRTKIQTRLKLLPRLIPCIIRGVSFTSGTMNSRPLREA